MYDTLLAVVALSSLTLYIPAREERATRFSTTALDHCIPFVPAFVFAYVGFVALFPMALALLSFTGEWEAFLLALIIAALLYVALGPFARYGVLHPEVLGRGVARRLVRHIYRLDGAGTRRTFPSVHVYLSLICAYSLSAAFPSYDALFWALATLVALSTVLIKQHNLIDVLGGALWALIAVYLSQLIVSLL
jgi:membrane-associated phospholipid phosphatase